MEESKIEKNKSKVNVKWAGIAITIAIIAILCIIAFCLNNSKPKNVFLNRINKGMEIYSKLINENQEKLNSTISVNGNVQSEDEDMKQVAEYLNQSDLTLNLQSDKQSKKMQVSANVNYQNENLLSGKVFYQSGDENIYIFVQDLFDKYFKVNVDETTEDNENLENLKGIFETNSLSIGEKVNLSKAETIIEDEIEGKFVDEYFTQEKVDGMKKTTINITVAQLRQIVTEISNDLQNNQEFLNCYENQDKIKESLNSIIESCDELSEYDEANIKISLYTKGIFASKMQKIEISIEADGDIVNLVVNKVDKQNYEYDFSTQRAENSEAEDFVKGNINISEVVKDDYKYVITSTIKDIGDITLNIEVKNTEETDLEKLDLSNSVNINDLTSAEQMQLYTNLMNMRIYKLFSNLLDSSTIY